MKRKYSWIPELPDFRDLEFKIEAPKILPPVVDLRNEYGLIYDQGSLGSCTANAIAMAFDFERAKQGSGPLLPSRLFIYYNERVMEGTVGYDSGAMIRDGIKSLAKQGVCAEKDWPYNPTRYTKKPSVKCFTEAKSYILKQYLSLTGVHDLKQCLADGFGFVFGFTVYESFESDEVARTGIVTIPQRREKILGGHAVYCVGYDDAKESFIVRNSWGEGWGDAGHFYLPYQYFERGLADDMWTLRLV